MTPDKSGAYTDIESFIESEAEKRISDMIRRGVLVVKEDTGPRKEPDI